MEENRVDVDTGQRVPKPAPKKRVNKKQILIAVLFVVLVVGGSAAAYWQRGNSAKKFEKQQSAEIDSLKAQVEQLSKDLDAEKAKSKETVSQPKALTACTAPSQDALDNVEAAITSGNTAALEGYMAKKVTVILAASEGLGVRTAAQATADVTGQIANATSPWDFNLPVATLNAYSTGDYAQYFPNGVLVGKSANKYVIAFTFNCEGDISVIFISASSDLL